MIDTVNVSRWCPITRQYATMDLPISQQEYESALKQWNDGALIQNCFPTLNADEREFLMTGMTPDVWKSVFGEDADNA